MATATWRQVFGPPIRAGRHPIHRNRSDRMAKSLDAMRESRWNTVGANASSGENVFKARDPIVPVFIYLRAGYCVCKLGGRILIPRAVLQVGMAPSECWRPIGRVVRSVSRLRRATRRDVVRSGSNWSVNRPVTKEVNISSKPKFNPIPS